MKALLILLFTLLTSISLANEIDKLKTVADVNQFLAEKVDKRFVKNPPLETDSSIYSTAKFGGNRFFKIDIDNNGLSDLIIYGYRFLSVIDEGSDKYNVSYFDQGLIHSSLIAIDSMKMPRKLIVWRRELMSTFDALTPKKIDTLIYKFNGFVEYNPKYVENVFNVKRIRLSTSGCFGECPIFEMIVYKNRTARYNAIRYTDREGSFWGAIPKNEYDELIALLKYINITTLKNDYQINWTDDETFTTEIKYNDIRKTISDYGGVGTYGLSLVYKKINDWRKSIDWKE